MWIGLLKFLHFLNLLLVGHLPVHEDGLEQVQEPGLGPGQLRVLVFSFRNLDISILRIYHQYSTRLSISILRVYPSVFYASIFNPPYHSLNPLI